MTRTVTRQNQGSFNFIGYDTSGGEHVMNLNADFDLYDYGNTEIERFSDEEIKQMKKQQKRYKTYIDERTNRLMQTNFSGGKLCSLYLR